MAANSRRRSSPLTPLLVVFAVAALSALDIFRINPALQNYTASEVFEVATAKISSSAASLLNSGFGEQRRDEETSEEELARLMHQEQATKGEDAAETAEQPGTTSEERYKSSGGSKTATQEKKEPLNVVLFYADDWSFETLGAMGNSYVKTPYLDQLAKEGMLFTHNCVTTSICMQSRATLYTGQYSSRHQTLYSWRELNMYEEDRWKNTLYPLMVKAGYYVGFYGKYHHLPFPKDIPTFSHHRAYYGSHFVNRGGAERHITELNEEDGIEFLETRPKDKPFFLTISFFATHAEDGTQEQYRPMNSSMSWYQDEPVPIPKTFTEKHWQDMPYFFDIRNFGRGRFMKRYKTPEMYQHHMKNTLRMATEVDAACGRMVEKLREQGLMDNTLIIFTTDNGNMHGQHGLAEKWYAYEESIRVPLIIRDPRMPPNMAGTKSEEFTLNIDLAPTILTAAGLKPPTVMQGRDMAPLYTNAEETAKSWRKEFFYEFRNDNDFIPNNIALVRKDFKFIFWEQQNYTQYFNLTEDPLEEVDLANQTDADLMAEARKRMEELEEITKQHIVTI